MGSVCTDGALAIIGHRSGFVVLVKQVAPHIVSNHCAFHKYALACKTLPLELKSFLDSVVKAVNFIRGNEQLYLHKQHLELQSSQAAETKFSSCSPIEFWCNMLQEYPELAKRALEALIPFPTTYLCEAAMSALVNIKTTYRNRLGVANDMRIALSDITPVLMSLFRRDKNRSHTDYHLCCVLPSK